MAVSRLGLGGNTPLFERMLDLDPLDVVHSLAMKAHQLYMALTPTNISQTISIAAENERTMPVYEMLRDWKYTEQWVEHCLHSFRRADTERQLDTLEWLVVLMRTCKSIGDLHHASAIHAAINNPAIIRLPAIGDHFLVLINKKQALETVEIVTNTAVYEQYLARRLESKSSTTPMLRPLLDFLRYSADLNSVLSQNIKLVKKFATILGDEDAEPTQKIHQFLVFQALDFRTSLQKKSLRRRCVTSGLTDVAVAQFLEEAMAIGESTYSQTTVIMSLSNRLLPWPEMFPDGGSIPKTLTPKRRLPRLASSISLGRTAIRKASDGSISVPDQSTSRSMSLSVESPLQTLCECFWGQTSSPAEKRARMLPILDDLVIQAAQRPNQFPAGDWEAILIESLSCLEEGDERPFRLLIITESTLQNWHFENRTLGTAERLRSTNDELTSRFGMVDDTTDVQRLLLFSLCSLVSHHVHEFRHDFARPQWTNLKELMQIVLAFVFVEDGPLVFRSVDALYNEGRCLDEGLLLICDQLLSKILAGDQEQVVTTTGELSAEARGQFRKTLASLRSVHEVIIEAMSALELIKTFAYDDRQYRLFPAVKRVRMLLSESKKTLEHSKRITTRLKGLIAFKKAATAKRNQNTVASMSASASIVGRLARLVLAESITRCKIQRDPVGLIRHVSGTTTDALVRRRSQSATELTTNNIIDICQSEQDAVVTDDSSRTPSLLGGHSRRRSSFPTKIVCSDLDRSYQIVHGATKEVDEDDDEDVVEKVDVGSEQTHGDDHEAFDDVVQPDAIGTDNTASRDLNKLMCD